MKIFISRLAICLIAISAISHSTVLAAPVLLPSGAVAWYKAEGGTADSGPNANSGTNVGGVGYAAGEVGQAFSFNGSSNYVNVSHSPSLTVTGTVSIEFWAKRNGFDVDVIAEKGGDWTRGTTNYLVGLHTPGLDYMFYFCSQATCRGTSGVQDGNWHHYAVVATDGASDVGLYLDGTLHATTFAQNANPIHLVANNKDLHIGAQIDPECCNYFGNDLVDELTIYNRALTPEEIAAIFQAGIDGKVSSLNDVPEPEWTFLTALGLLVAWRVFGPRSAQVAVRPI